MASVHRRTKSRRYLTPLDWPSSFDAEIDGVRWGLAEGPSEADSKWAAENMNQDVDAHAVDGPPADDPIWDVWAQDAADRDRVERGYIL